MLLAVVHSPGDESPGVFCFWDPPQVNWVIPEIVENKFPKLPKRDI